MTKLLIPITVLFVLACQPQVDIQTPPIEQAVIEGNIICESKLAGYEKYDSNACPGGKVMVGFADNGVECAQVVTGCWVKKR